MIGHSLFYLIYLPILAGLLLFWVSQERFKKNLAQLIFSFSLFSSVVILFRPVGYLAINLIANFDLVLGLNKLSNVILIFINLFGFLVCLYSRKDIEERGSYFSYLLWLIAFSNLIVFSCDFILFVFAWGVTLVLLYAFLSLGSAETANKALSIVGVADFALILGVCLYIVSSGTTIMPQAPSAKLFLNNPFAWASFLLMLTAALAKAGCGPFHTWITKAAETSSLPVMAILPASLDKLLGIYLLSRICVDFFSMNTLAMALLMLIGSLTIIFAVMMALIQHDLRKLLAYHAISQVGYMVLGFGTGNVLGIAGGIFHMINNAIYKSGLFLTAGAIGEQKKTFELDRLGGLAVSMPVTFVAGLVFSLSISGIPPFNGFASKWLLYQGAIAGLSVAPNIYLVLVFIFALVAAMFGSALTLASFIKFIHAVFLDRDNSDKKERAAEPALSVTTPLVILAALCVILGVLPQILLKNFIEPWLGRKISVIGVWDSQLAFIVLIIGLLLGWVYSFLGNNKVSRKDKPFIGTEDPDPVGASFPATEFYRTVEEAPGMSRAYKILKIQAFDFYNVFTGLAKFLAYIFFIFVDRLINLITILAGKSVLALSWILRKIHTGVLDFYLVWCLVGLIALFFILMGR
jgi:formate hydrogenlyase subunit 3/multisubunit Na+/H+ antiporter MnhD subunit